jgi:DNA-binding NarL/FixJ family response regulator
MLFGSSSLLVDAEREFAFTLVSRLPPRWQRQVTPAEQELLGLLCAGLPSKKIAAELNKSERTIDNQISHCLQKFGVRSRSHLVARLNVLASPLAGRTERLFAPAAASPLLLAQ